MQGMSGEKILGHALHEKGIQRQKAVRTLVNSQQRRALAVPLLNSCSTADEPLVNGDFCSSTGLHRISFVRACEEMFRTVVYGTLEGYRDGWLPGRPKCRHPVLPSFALPRRAPCTVRRADPTRPLCVRVLDSTG